MTAAASADRAAASHLVAALEHASAGQLGTHATWNRPLTSSLVYGSWASPGPRSRA